MTINKRREGDETWHRLQSWTKGQKASERLAGHILNVEGYKSINPIHPLGGADGIKDLICKKENKKYIVAVYFPRKIKSFTAIKSKLKDDQVGIKRNKADGIIFITNQELKESERKILRNMTKDSEIYHLERLALVLDQPISYGARLEYLDIEMNKEEQVSFFENIKKEINKNISELLNQISSDLNVPIKELEKFREILTEIAGSPRKSINLSNVLTSSLFLSDISPIDKLQNIPVGSLKKFEKILTRIAGPRTDSFMSATHFMPLHSPSDFPINRLHVPLEELKEYEKVLDRIIKKTKILRKKNEKGN